MACVAAGFFVGIKVVFLLHGGPLPAPFDSVVLTAVAVITLLTVMVAGSIWMVRSLGTAATGARIRRETKAAASVFAEERDRRVAELAADPKRAQYAPLVERGEDWSDENIAYYEDPDRAVTCAHLQPMERAMRQAGIDVRRYRETDVSAKCCIDFDALQRAFAVVPPVRYAEFFAGERYEFEHPMAYLTCDEHELSIHTVHPEESGARTLPSFPDGRTA